MKNILWIITLLVILTGCKKGSNEEIVVENNDAVVEQSDGESQLNLAVLLKEGSETFIFEKVVNVRIEASTGSEVVTKAAFGDKVTIIQKMDSKEVLYGINAHWYKIEIDGKTGFIWGGLLSTIHQQADFNLDGEQDILLSRCTSYGEGYYGDWGVSYAHLTRLLLSNGTLIKKPFAERLREDTTLSTKTVSLVPPVTLLKVNFSMASGRSSEDYTDFYYFKDNQFYLITSIMSTMDEREVVSYLDGYEMVVNKSKILYEYGEFEGDMTEIGEEVLSSRSYKWDGTSFEEIK